MPGRYDHAQRHSVGHEAIAGLALQTHSESRHRAGARWIRLGQDTADHSYRSRHCGKGTGDVRVAEVDEKTPPALRNAYVVCGRAGPDDLDLSTIDDRLIPPNPYFPHAV